MHINSSQYIISYTKINSYIIKYLSEYKRIQYNLVLYNKNNKIVIIIFYTLHWRWHSKCSISIILATCLKIYVYTSLKLLSLNLCSLTLSMIYTLYNSIQKRIINMNKKYSSLTTRKKRELPSPKNDGFKNKNYESINQLFNYYHLTVAQNF